MTSNTQIPEDFTWVPVGVGFAEVFAPLFIKQNEEEAVLGMRVEKNISMALILVMGVFR